MHGFATDDHARTRVRDDERTKAILFENTDNENGRKHGGTFSPTIIEPVVVYNSTFSPVDGSMMSTALLVVVLGNGARPPRSVQ